MSLANDYRPKDWEDVTEQGLTVKILKNICEQETLSCRNFLLTGPAGTGKAQPLDSKVLTPNGFIRMGDVTVGTEVYTHTGAVAKVSGVYPQGIRPIYEITLSDRTKIRVSDEHLNLVYRYNTDKKKREDYVLTTVDLIEFFRKSAYKLRIDIPQVDWVSQQLPIDPYLLGLLIGDGSLAHNFGFTNSESDVVQRMNTILKRDWDCYLNKLQGDNFDYRISPCEDTTVKLIFKFKSVEYIGRTAMRDAWCAAGYPVVCTDTIAKIGCMIAEGDYSFCESFGVTKDMLSCSINPKFGTISGAMRLRNILSDLKLDCKSVDKHIPSIYLRSSYSNRIALLQGLIDTDGYISVHGSSCVSSFSTSSKLLSEDFAFLVRSLGIRDTISKKTNCGYKSKKTGEFVHCRDHYVHHLKVPKDLVIFSSEKHKARWKPSLYEPMRNIVSIEYIGDMPCQCIYVDHEDHTYISDDFIPTHNTTIARLMAKKLNGNIDVSEIVELDAASHSSVDDIREIVAQAQSYPVIGKYKTILVDECHSLSDKAWQALLCTLESTPARTIFFLCTTNPEKIPKTITSRVQQFQLSKISLKGIEDRLKYVLDSEIAKGKAYTYTEDGITFLAKLANGGMRDALSLLDKLLAYSHDVTSDNVTQSLVSFSYDDFFILLGAAAVKDNAKVAMIIDTVYNSGINFVKWFEDFHSFIMNVAKFVLLQDISKTTIPAQYVEKLSKYNMNHYTICLKLANIVMALNQELRYTNYQQETALTRLCSTVPLKKVGDKK